MQHVAEVGEHFALSVTRSIPTMQNDRQMSRRSHLALLPHNPPLVGERFLRILVLHIVHRRTVQTALTNPLYELVVQVGTLPGQRLLHVDRIPMFSVAGMDAETHERSGGLEVSTG